MRSAADHINQHLSAGRFFEAAGVRSFVRESGSPDDEPVVLVHGVPTSSFLWRKVLAELAARGRRGVAFDLPGLGLADRPGDYDYSWTGLGRFAVAAVEELGLLTEGFHLVIHDIGGPVGLELLAAVGPGRVRSLTVLDTMVEVDVFQRPWMMELFARRGIGELWLAGATRPAWAALMRIAGGTASYEEWTAHLDLLKRGDGGRAFLKIMRGFERTPEKRDLYVGALDGYDGPAQVVWGGRDTALPVDPLAYYVQRALGGDAPLHVLPRAKHFPQEDHAAELAGLVAGL